MKLDRRVAAAIGAALLSGATGVLGYTYAANGLRVVDYCDAAECGSLSEALAIGLAPVELILCCNYVTGDCVLVSSLSECHPEFEYAVVCDYGQSAPVEGETICYE